MPYTSIGQVPSQIKKHQGKPLTLAQANHWARIFDRLKNVPGIGSPAAVAWSTWEKVYIKTSTGWVKK